MSIADNIRGFLNGKKASQFSTQQKSQFEPTGKELSQLSPRELRQILGGTGTNFSNGYISEEYNTLFVAPTCYSTYDEMYRSDSTVFKMLSAAQMSILAGDRKVEPGKDREGNVSPEAIEQAEFIDRNLREVMEGGFEQFLAECLNFIRDGVSVFEKVYMMQEGQILLKKLGVRLPKSISKRETKDGNPGITQQLTNTEDAQEEKKTDPSIPAYKLLVFTHRKEGRNYAGMSILRPVGKNRVAKKALENFELIGYETQFKGIKKVRVPSSMSAETKNVILESIADIDIGNDNIMILPGTKDEFDIEFLTMDLPSAQRLQEAIKRHDNKISDILLAIFMKLGESERGSYGMSQSGMDFFYRGLKVLAKQVCDVLNKYLIRELIDLNYNDVEYYPTISVGELGEVDIVFISEAIERLQKSGFIAADLESEQILRKKLGLLPRSTENQGDDKSRPKVSDDKGGSSDNPNFHQHGPGCGHNTNLIFEELKNSFDFSFDLPGGEDLKKKSFSKVNNYYRPLTFAEEKMDLSLIKKTLLKYEEQFKKEFGLLSSSQKQNILQQIAKAIENNDIKAIDQLTAGKSQEMIKLVRSIRAEMFDFGKNMAANEIDAVVPATSIETKSYMTLQSAALANKAIDVIESRAKATALEMIGKNAGSIATLQSAAVVTAVSQTIDRVVKDLTASVQTLSVVGGFNVGRNFVFNKNSDRIYCYQYVSILDDRTTDRCLSLDGRTFLPGSQEAKDYRPPQHINCRGSVVSVLVDETFKPKITGVPKSIPPVRDLYTTEPLKRPYIVDGSPAMQQLQQELRERQAKLEEYKNEGIYPNRQKQHENRINDLKKSLRIK